MTRTDNPPSHIYRLIHIIICNCKQPIEREEIEGGLKKSVGGGAGVVIRWFGICWGPPYQFFERIQLFLTPKITQWPLATYCVFQKK